MARAATAGELTKLRSSGQFSKLFLAIHKPAAVFAALVNQTFDSTDDVSEITFDTVTTGAYTDILAGMTCYVGSSAGAYDLGMVRIRKAATSTVLYIGRTSEIEWADNLYLTVVDEFGLWAKHWYTPNDTAIYMDQDVLYYDQNSAPDPVPVLGPDAVLWLTGATVDFTPDASGSWVTGSTINGYSWGAPGASATANLNTATPTITYNAAGVYRVSCTVSTTNSKSATGYRNVFVFSAASMPVTDFVLEACAGDGDGWSFRITLYDDAALTDIRDRAKVILFAKDWYGGTEGSIGPITGYENIIAIGWADEESIETDPNKGTVTITVRGPAYWLNKLAAFPGGLKNTTSAPDGWDEAQNLTIDMALHNLFHWRSTVDAVLDWYPSNDVRVAGNLTTAPGTLWNQARDILAQILAEPRCDRYGRLITETDTQYLALADRAALPVVQLVTSADWRGTLRIPRKTAGELAMLETSGMDAADTYLSRSFGKVPGLYGTIEQRNNLLVTDQDDINAVTGMIVAQRNNAYPSIPVSLASNHRLIDIAPRQYLTLTLQAGDTARGIVWTAKKFIPRRVSYRHDNGYLLTDVELEAETSGPAGMTVIPPQIVQDALPPIVPIDQDFPDLPPPDTWFPPVVPPELEDCSGSGNNGPYPASFDGTVVYADETKYAYFPATVHPTGDAYETEFHLSLDYHGDASPINTHVQAIDADQSPVANTSNDTQGVYTFDGASDLAIAGVSVSVDAGGLYEPVKLLYTGSFDTTEAGSTDVTGLDPDKVYCVRSTGSWVYNLSGDLSYMGISATGGAAASGVAGDGIHNNQYLKPTAGGQITVAFTDTTYGDNEGTQGWALYECRSNRYVVIRDSYFYNVCA